MSGNEERSIRPAVRRDVTISLPPSKSYTQRGLVAAALADGESVIINPSRSDDSRTLAAALGEFGVTVTDLGDRLVVAGCGGRPAGGDRTIDVGNAGTCMRFLAAFASLAPGTTTITGDDAMLRRPVSALVGALRQAGVDAACDGDHPPVRVKGGPLPGGAVTIDPAASSQFLSALLLVAPFARHGLEVRIDGPLPSAPYVAMTVAVMDRFGVGCRHAGNSWHVTPGPRYRPAVWGIEPDLSAATVFGAAAAVTGATVRLPGIPARTLQGDIRFFGLIREMGCRVVTLEDGLEVTGGPLTGITADLNGLPDSVPALAVTAAFASTPTTITNVAHLRYKESDRLRALSTELRKIGAASGVDGGSLSVAPGPVRGAVIDTYDDHRIAMSFAVAGLAAPGMAVRNPGCVTKSFPGFWTELEKFHDGGK